MNFIQLYQRWQKHFYNAEKFIATVLMLAISGVVLAGVFSRYLLREPFYGTDRLATYLFVVLSFWGIQMASGYYEHITVGVVRHWFSPFWGAVASALASLFSAFFLAYLSIAAYKFVRFLYEGAEKDIVLGIPLWLVYSFFVLSSVISAFRYGIGAYLWLEVARGRIVPEAFQHKSLV
ncbi:MAG: TRAP transporter small permease subunit [Bacteroidia bacterium]|nr:TRAP transporter small permease subunit [Bacteroidia bacterium]MDW8133916.1 TRAP transporter small permease subunit [Bacteroidia bacterium]